MKKYSLDFFRNQYFGGNRGTTSNVAQHTLAVCEQHNTVVTKSNSKRRSFKKSPLIYIVLSLCITNVSFAEWQFEGKGRVLNEEQHLSAGTINGGLIDKPIELSPPKKFGASANAVAVSASGAVNSTFNVFGQHSVYIKNTTHYSQRYKYYYQLCADTTKCIYYSGNIELNPGSIGQNQATSYVTVQFSQPGTYHSEAKTQVAGEQTAYNVDQGYISIFKP